jgi:hypothetical protein
VAAGGVGDGRKHEDESAAGKAPNELPRSMGGLSAMHCRTAGGMGGKDTARNRGHRGDRLAQRRVRPSRGPDVVVQARVERFIVEQYTAGRSLRELAELTDRSFSALRNILDKHGVRRRAVGAARLLDEPGTTAAG